MVSAAIEAPNWNSLPPMMLPARSCSIAGVVDISRVTRTSTGRVNVVATVPTASQVSVLFEVDRLRKSVSVALKKLGGFDVDGLERLGELCGCELKRLSAADGIGAPKSKRLRLDRDDRSGMPPRPAKEPLYAQIRSSLAFVARLTHLQMGCSDRIGTVNAMYPAV